MQYTSVHHYFRQTHIFWKGIKPLTIFQIVRSCARLIIGGWHHRFRRLSDKWWEELGLFCTEVGTDLAVEIITDGVSVAGDIYQTLNTVLEACHIQEKAVSYARKGPLCLRWYRAHVCSITGTTLSGFESFCPPVTIQLHLRMPWICWSTWSGAASSSSSSSSECYWKTMII